VNRLMAVDQGAKVWTRIKRLLRLFVGHDQSMTGKPDIITIRVDKKTGGTLVYELLAIQSYTCHSDSHP